MVAAQEYSDVIFLHSGHLKKPLVYTEEVRYGRNNRETVGEGEK